MKTQRFHNVRHGDSVHIEVPLEAAGFFGKRTATLKFRISLERGQTGTDLVLTSPSPGEKLRLVRDA